MFHDGGKCQQEIHAWVSVFKCLRVNELTSTPLSELTWDQWDVHTSRAVFTWHHSLSFPAINFFKALLPIFLHRVLHNCVFWLPCVWFLCSHDSAPLRPLSFVFLSWHVCFLLFFWLTLGLAISKRSAASAYFATFCVCSSGAAQWSGAKHKLETRRISAGFFLQGNDNMNCRMNLCDQREEMN